MTLFLCTQLKAMTDLYHLLHVGEWAGTLKPETTAVSAHRLVAKSLGMSASIDREKLKKENEKLEVARGEELHHVVDSSWQGCSYGKFWKGGNPCLPTKRLALNHIFRERMLFSRFSIDQHCWCTANVPTS